MSPRIPRSYTATSNLASVFLRLRPGEKEKEKEEEDNLETFFCKIHEFHNPVPVTPVFVPAELPPRYAISFVPADSASVSVSVSDFTPAVNATSPPVVVSSPVLSPVVPPVDTNSVISSYYSVVICEFCCSRSFCPELCYLFSFVSGIVCEFCFSRYTCFSYSLYANHVATSYD